MRKKGFTLIELIIVIAILAILAAILIPSMVGYINMSQKTVCDDNVAQIARTFQMKRATDHSVSLRDVVENKDGAYFTTMPECPNGGEYKSFSITDYFYVMCTHHKNPSSALDLAAESYMYMDDFRGMTQAEILTELREGLGDPTINSTTNDTLRRYLYEVKYGGSWPQFPQDVLDRNGIKGTYYIQPYIDKVKGDSSSNDVTVFATKSNSTTGGWFTDLIFNPEDGEWYTGPSFSMNDKPWAEVKKVMQDRNWKMLK